jgi:hypothetical protein
MPDKDVFAERCKTDPEGVVKDLVAQTMRQARSIHELNEKLGKLEKEYEKLKKLIPEE